MGREGQIYPVALIWAPWSPAEFVNFLGRSKMQASAISPVLESSVTVLKTLLSHESAQVGCFLRKKLDSQHPSCLDR